jgi:ABC-type nickel/cobalt efflux system permease component RcnA
MLLMNESLSFALGLGFLLGLKHATEADHLVAVTTIVSEQRSVWRSSLVGALWGVGHTASLFAAGVIVILSRTAIPEHVAAWLEFCVAVMIIFLGSRILFLLLRGRRQIHVHAHTHDGHAHKHLHFHDAEDAHAITDKQTHSHYTRKIGIKPLIIGMVHGLAGSAVLTLLVLSEVMRGGSRVLGLAYLLVFGIGSIGGMLLMSAIISLPFVYSDKYFERINTPMRLVAGLGSVAFGLYYAWQTAGGL